MGRTAKSKTGGVRNDVMRHISHGRPPAPPSRTLDGLPFGTLVRHSRSWSLAFPFAKFISVLLRGSFSLGLSLGFVS